MPKLATGLDQGGSTTMARLAKGQLPEGRYSDGQGLTLAVSKTGAAFWYLRYQKRDRGLGKANGQGARTLKQARDAAAAMRHAIDNGQDPLIQKDQQQEAEAKQHDTPTFQEAARQYVQHKEAGWDDAYRRLVTNGLANHAGNLMNIRVSEINREHVLAVIRPIWTEKPKAAKNVLADIQRVLDFAKAKDWRIGDNPAAWATMQYHLPKLAKGQTKAKHHAMMKAEEIPYLMAQLQKQQTSEASCLQLLILTACRLDEIRLAQWKEIDLANATWTIPQERLKVGGKDHVVPLSPQALAILKAQRAKHPTLDPNAYVFPGQKADVIAYNMPLLTLKRMLRKDQVATVHGFRASFSTWAAKSGIKDHVAELCLAHAIGGAVERAYQRSTLEDMRRDALQRWADAVTPKQAEVRPLKTGVAA